MNLFTMRFEKTKYPSNKKYIVQLLVESVLYFIKEEELGEETRKRFVAFVVLSRQSNGDFYQFFLCIYQNKV